MANVTGRFPPWRTVHEYFLMWSEPLPGDAQSLLEKLPKELVTKARVQNSRSPTSSLLIVDAQSVKNTAPAAEKGYAAGKRVSGIKRHLVVDSLGLPHGSLVTTANVTDREAALELFQSYAESLPTVTTVLVVGSYRGAQFASMVLDLIGATVQVAKRSELHQFAVIPTRWVVERSFGRLDKCRRLWKNCERYLRTSHQMVVLAFRSLRLKRF